MDEGPCILVTGGSRGVGAAICQQAAARGFDVAFTYQSRVDEAQAVVAAIRRTGRRALAVQADLASQDDISRLFVTVGETFGRLDALVNNAGLTGPVGPFQDADLSAVARMIDVNLVAPMRCIQHALPLMSGLPAAGIVNISSGAAQTGSPGRYVGYAASKAGLETFTRGLAQELAPRDVRVNAVSPGITDTDLHAAPPGSDKRARLEMGVPLGRMAAPEEIARPVLWLLSSEAAYVTGAVLRVGGGR